MDFEKYSLKDFIYIPLTNDSRAGLIGPIESLWVLFYFISFHFYYFFSNYSVLAQLGFSLAWLGWAVTKIPAVSGFLPFPGSKYTQKEAPNIFTSDFMDNLVVFDLYNLAQVAYLV